MKKLLISLGVTASIIFFPASAISQTYIPQDIPAIATSTSSTEGIISAILGSSSPMIDVIQCESHFHQFDALGGVLTSPTGDVGIFQIHVSSWGQTARKLGLDIYSTGGNIAMGIYIYKTAGISQWTCAKMLGLL